MNNLAFLKNSIRMPPALPQQSLNTSLACSGTTTSAAGGSGNPVQHFDNTPPGYFKANTVPYNGMHPPKNSNLTSWQLHHMIQCWSEVLKVKASCLTTLLKKSMIFSSTLRGVRLEGGSAKNRVSPCRTVQLWYHQKLILIWHYNWFLLKNTRKMIYHWVRSVK